MNRHIIKIMIILDQGQSCYCQKVSVKKAQEEPRVAKPPKAYLDQSGYDGDVDDMIIINDLMTMTKNCQSPLTMYMKTKSLATG